MRYSSRHMSKHTPGPWEAYNWSCTPLFGVSVPPGHLSANCISECMIEADARLIAAAPEMLKALEEIYQFTSATDCGSGSGEWQSLELEKAFKKVHEAIIKARGDE